MNFPKFPPARNKKHPESKQTRKNKEDLLYITIDRTRKKKGIIIKNHWGRIVKGKQETFFQFLYHVHHHEIRNSLSSVSPLHSHSNMLFCWYIQIIYTSIILVDFSSTSSLRYIRFFFARTPSWLYSSLYRFIYCDVGSYRTTTISKWLHPLFFYQYILTSSTTNFRHISSTLNCTPTINRTKQQQQ